MHVVDSVHRHCDSCAKNVVDFSQMSDDEVLLFFRNSKGNICGRFKKDQLQRSYTRIPEKARPAQWWKAAALLPLTLFAKGSAAQNDSLATADSLIAQNDTTIHPVEIQNDSNSIAVDSAVTDSPAQEIPSIEETSILVEFNPSLTHVYGNACLLPPDPLYVLGGTYVPPPSPLQGFLSNSWLSNSSKNQLTPTNSALLSDTEKQKPEEEPVPATLPEHPWYEAVLPRSWRIRKP